MTGFFDKQKGRRSPAASRIDEDFARRLLGVLKSLDPGIKGSVAAWADHFRMLGKEQPEDEIERVVNWFELHAGKRWTPIVRSARQFREKFGQLQAAVERHEEDCPTAAVSAEAVLIQAELGGLSWPGDEKKDELVLIQRSLDGHRAWMNSVRRTKTRNPGMVGLCDWLLAVHGDPGEFVRRWVESVHQIAWTNERWAGKLGRHVAGVKHPRYRKMISSWISEYKGNRGDWWEFLEENFVKGDVR